MDELTDPAWDEYLSTGEDPTGGELEGNSQRKSNHPQSPGPGCGLLFVLCTCVFLAVVSLTEKAKGDKEAQRKIENQQHNALLLQNELQRQHKQDSIYARIRASQDSADRAHNEEVALRKREQAELYREQMIARARKASYDDGYHDGYECGYDDGDCNEGYGYSWISEDMSPYYSASYKKGFSSGYRDGFIAGSEDYEYQSGI